MTVGRCLEGRKERHLREQRKNLSHGGPEGAHSGPGITDDHLSDVQDTPWVINAKLL